MVLKGQISVMYNIMTSLNDVIIDRIRGEWVKDMGIKMDQALLPASSYTIL